MTIALPRTGPHPVRFGQVHGALTGQVLLSIDDGPLRVVEPSQDGTEPGCATGGWASVRVEVDPAEGVVGENRFRWKVGP